MNRFSKLLSSSLASGLLLSGCEGDSFLGQVSEAQEIQIGQQAHAELTDVKNGGTRLFQEPTVNAYVNQIGAELVAKSARPNLTHQFFVLDTPEINAFAIPGGYVYVTTALIKNMKTRAELAGVMGHEVGHISAYHGAEAIQTNLGLFILSGIFLGEGEAAEVLNFVVGSYLNTAHSQEQELEADELGVEYSSAAGYNPWGLVDFFGFIGDLSGTSDPVSDFLSSHPAPTERISEASAQIEKLGIAKDDPKYEYQDNQFLQIRDIVIAGSAN